MPESKWEVVDTVAGELQAELLRGYLEAQGIPAYISQEGLGHFVYPVTVGPLARIDILVSSEQVQSAMAALERYYSGSLEAEQDEAEQSTGEDSDQDQG